MLTMAIVNGQLGVEFGSKLLTIPEENKVIKLQCWDTAGTESFRSITRSYYRGAAGCLLVYDVTSRKSFVNTRMWLKDVREHADPNLTCILVGNKVDLCETSESRGSIDSTSTSTLTAPGRRQVPIAEAQAFAEEEGLLFVESSAKSGENVDKAFEEAAKDILAKIQKGVFDDARINDDWSWRYLIVFATRAVADEWWRAVSTSSNTAYSGTVVRVTPQFYTHDPSRANIAYSINDASVAKKFLGTVIFTLLPDRDGRAFQLIQPSPEPITDYISNSWFYIRSKGDRSVYWHCNNKGTIVASRTNSTRFLVRNTDHSFDGKVMINPDDITLSLASGKLSVHVTDAGNLQASPKADKFKFGDFLDGYSINGNGWIIVDGLPDNAIVKVNDNSGEAWELVMNGRVYE
ncbi:hypothetical protein AAF712_002291 [Marasmius tenuissimus]|uniref:Uncharacterized protein n=1 Tax=Marasmius tenuissimus TaxID=585030 RepID=A0ABR3AAV3_9AGAR